MAEVKELTSSIVESMLPRGTVYRHASFQGSLDDALSGGVYDYSSGITTGIPARVFAYGTLEVMEGYNFVTQRLTPHQVRNDIAMASRVWYRSEAAWQPWVFFTGAVQSS